MINSHKSLVKYDVIGLMSGTSLDGLDLAFCRILVHNNNWEFDLKEAETISYPKFWKNKILDAEKMNESNLADLHVEYGIYLGNEINKFISKHNIKPDFIASHGHTIFHEPQKKITFQLGDGESISKTCHLPVVYDFRSLDVELGGQGAPLVPIGDKLLFSDYDYCLNLGGFANISYEFNSERIAFDICPVNIVMNYYAEKLGKEFDNNGSLAREGDLNIELLENLNQLTFYHLPLNQPKSLGKEWVLKNIFPLIEKFEGSTKNILRTFCEHVAIQITKTLSNSSSKKMLITGGGVYNKFLLERISALTSTQLIVPEKKVIEFKEALIFALLGVLKMRGEINCLKSVTGASRDSSGGKIYVSNFL